MTHHRRHKMAIPRYSADVLIFSKTTVHGSKIYLTNERRRGSLRRSPDKNQCWTLKLGNYDKVIENIIEEHCDKFGLSGFEDFDSFIFSR